MISLLFIKVSQWSLLLLLIIFTSPPQLIARQTHTIQILVTSDIHGWNSTSLIYPNRKRKGILHLIDSIKKARSKNPELILLDAGDMLQGSPLTGFYHVFSENPASDDPFFKSVISAKYDAVIVGNHDLAVNPHFEESYLPASPFPWLAANVYRRGKALFQPYTIINRGDIKIAILGFTTPGSLMWLNPEQLGKMKIEAVDSSAASWMNVVKRKENPDLIIGVFHTGFNPFRDDENSKLNRIPKANSIHEAIRNVKGFDLILTGHDHRLFPSKHYRKIRYYNNIPVIGGGQRAEALLILNLLLAKEDRRWKITDIKHWLKRASQHKTIERRYIDSLSQTYKRYIFEELPWEFTLTTTAQASTCLNILNSLANDSPDLAGTMLPRIQLKTIKYYYKRRIRRLDLFRWLKYDNKPVTITLSRRDIYLLNNPHPVFGRKRVSYNKILFSRFKIPSMAYNNQSWWLDANQFEKKFQVNISDYHFNGGGGIIPQLFFKKKYPITKSNIYIRDRLFKFLKSGIRTMPAQCGFVKYNKLSLKHTENRTL